ncbi:MAG: hypothetical protein AAF512_21325, partial [Pseudomonadota bacterium]
SCFANLLDGEDTEVPFQLNHTESSAKTSHRYNTMIRLYVDPSHRGQPADIFLVGAYQAPDMPDFQYYSLIKATWTPFELTAPFSLPPEVTTVSSLPATLDIPIHYGVIPDLTGEFRFFAGYQLQDGTIVHNGYSIQTWLVK